MNEAVLSDCGQYRYLLTRRWGPGPTATFTMLNPSTADGGRRRGGGDLAQPPGAPGQRPLRR